MASSIPPAFPDGLLPLTWGLIVVFAVLLFARLSSAPLWYGGECRSAARAREFLVTGKLWTVQEDFDPSFHRPPPHHWLTATTPRWLGQVVEFVRD